MTTKRPPKHPAYQGVEDDPTIEYPSSDGEPMAEDEWQLTAMIDAISALRAWFESREEVYVGGDMLIYYHVNDNRTRVAPDVFVVLDAEKKEPRDSWIIWREGKPPDFVMEVASGSTWRRDMREKRDIYAEMGVAEYWRFDASGSYFAPPLSGERLADGEYAQIPLETDSEGRLRGYSAILGLDLCILADGALRFQDPVTGQWLRTPRESEAALRQAEETAQRETEARQAAEAATEREAAARRAAEEELRLLREQLQRHQEGEPGESA